VAFLFINGVNQLMAKNAEMFYDNNDLADYWRIELPSTLRN
jgi:hypothetical protein